MQSKPEIGGDLQDLTEDSIVNCEMLEKCVFSAIKVAFPAKNVVNFGKNMSSTTLHGSFLEKPNS